MTLPSSPRSRQSLWRLRTTLWPILETAGAAVTAWYLAKLLLSERETGFAPIAAVICLGAAIGQQRECALELMGGVVLGVLIADLLVRALGSGPPQVGLMVVMAMSAAALVGGGSLLMTEAGVSAIIIGSTVPSTLGLFPVRPIEGLIGGAVAFAFHALLFPPDPLRHVGLAANAVFSSLGRALQDLAAALRTGDREQAERALEQARGIDGAVRALGDALALGRDTARSAPLRRSARGALDRQEEISRHLDFAVRNTRVLARDTVRYARSGGAPVLGPRRRGRRFRGGDLGATPTSRSPRSPGRFARPRLTSCGRPRPPRATRPGSSRHPRRRCWPKRSTPRPTAPSRRCR